MTPFDKFSATRKELSATLIERDAEIDLVLTGLVAQEHVLLVGPPGTGKSFLADALVGWMQATKFSLLVTKFTTPEEMFGPISVPGLKADKYRRIVDNKLPTAEVAFIDEIFKSSSAILNTMLQVLNERTFRNDDKIVLCPLRLCVAASNEWPGSQEGGKELGALFDRFLLRKFVRPVATEKGLNRLLWDYDLVPTLSTTITLAEIDQACLEAFGITWCDEAKESLHSIHREAKLEGICPGDRRLRKSVRVVQAFAWLNGASEVQPDHLEILSDVLWDDPQEQPQKLAQIVGKIANPTGMKVNGLLMEAEQVIGGTNVKDLTQAATADKKLREINKQLAGVPGSRAEHARDYIRDQLRSIKMATLAAID